MNKLPFNRVLVLSPHADDAELGAGGTIARFVEQGAIVDLIVFSGGHNLTGATREEFEASMDVLGAVGSFHHYPCRHFPEHRQAILQEIIAARDRFGPDLVIAPSTTDSHQDHQVVAAEAIRACKWLTIWGYEQPWNAVFPFGPDVFVTLGIEHLRAKQGAVTCYESQWPRTYARPEILGGIALVRGLMVGTAWAEAFEVMRWIL